MLDAFLSHRAKRVHVAGHALSCALAFALSTTACSPSDAPSEETSDESDSDDDTVKEKPKADAGSKKDAQAPADEDDDAPADDDDAPVANVDAGKKPDAAQLSASWCQVQPILEKHCSACHDGTGTGPMKLTSAADFAVNAPITKSKKVYESVSARLHDTAKPMPPPPKKVSDEDMAVLDAWLAAKAPEGTEKCGDDTPTTLPNGKVDGWDPEKCDAIYEIRSHGTGGKDQPYTVPAGQEIHPQVRVDAPWGNDKVQAIGFRPITDNKKVLHHWILNNASRQFLAGWAPGDEERPPFPDDVGMDMPSGAGAFTLDMHYYNTGAGAKAEQDRSGVEVCVLKQEHFRKNVAAVTGSFASTGNGFVLAPRQSENKDITSVCNVSARSPVHLLTAAPHAHKYAVHMKFTVTKKNGTQIIMHDAPWVFGEQGTYPLPGGEVLIETGDKVTTTCTYTNKTNKDITFGESTENEMCFNFALYYPKGGFSCSGGGAGIDLGSAFGGP